MSSMQVNFESKVVLTQDQAYKLLRNLLPDCCVDLFAQNSPSADNGIMYTAVIDYAMPSNFVLTQLFYLSLLLGQDCIAYFDSGSSGVAKGFIGPKPYAKFDDDLFIEFYSGKPLSQAAKHKN